MRQVFEAKTRVVIIAFSLADKDSFDSITTKWLPEKKETMPDAKVSQIIKVSWY